MTFNDLKFLPHPGFPEGVQALAVFPNGYVVSVVFLPGSYGYSYGLYEAAVGVGDKDNWELCYDTPITSDVLGYQTKNDITTVLRRVEKLPPCGKGIKMESWTVNEDCCSVIIPLESGVYAVAYAGTLANARLAAAAPKLLTLLAQIKWIPTDKDNMEFKGKITCFELDEIRKVIKEAHKGTSDG